jgi:hypothetical protein
MDRLARNLEDLRAVVRTMTSKGFRVEFLKENLLVIGEDSPMTTLMLSVMGLRRIRTLPDRRKPTRGHHRGQTARRL